MPLPPSQLGMTPTLDQVKNLCDPRQQPGWPRAMACAYLPDGTTYNGERNILTDEQVARLSVGSPFDDKARTVGRTSP